MKKIPRRLYGPLRSKCLVTFIARALSIVRKQDDNTSITDACRLVDAALKAARGDGSTPGAAPAADDGLKGLIEELHTGYEKLRAAQAAGQTTAGESEL